jgi:hypothetical protein
MSKLELKDLIYQVKREMLTSSPQQFSRDSNSLFFIDKIEMEIVVNVSQTRSGGVRLTVMDFAENGFYKSSDQPQGHVVKVSLSPLLSREEMVAEALKNPSIKRMMRKWSAEAWMQAAV